MEKRAVIGMSMSLDYADIFRESWDIGRMGVMWNYLSQTYVTALERAGAVPVAIPMVDDPSILIPFIDSLDGFLLTGGNDIDPMCYGEVDRGRCGRIVREREEQEILLVRHILEKTDKPLLAICRGQQLLNVALGGSLIQDLEAEGFRSHSKGNHAMDAVTHFVDIEPGSLLEGILSKGHLGVNSFHHQAVDRLGEGLCVAATSDDGIVEALELPSRKAFTLAVQWHPEKMYDNPDSRRIFSAFVQAASR